MNLLRLCIASLRFRILANAFNVLILAMGIALILTLLQMDERISQRFNNDLKGIDLVVGAKGSPLQLILSSIFHLDVPTGNIALEEAEKLKTNPFVKTAIPLALGDNYHGFRIVGTTQAYHEHYKAELATGQWWFNSMEAVLGSEAARKSGLKPGDRFAGTHGLTGGGEEHTATPYTVKGIMKPTGTVLDRLILCDIPSIWGVHHHDEDDPKGEENEITSLLITYKTPLAAASLPRLINKTTSMQAASPAMEVARMMNLLGTGGDIISLFAKALMVIATAGMFLSLLGSVNERRYDLALLRTLGMTRRRIFLFVILQGLIIGLLGAAIGLALGNAMVTAATGWIESTRHMTLAHLPANAYENTLIVYTLLLSTCAALIPAILAYRMNIAAVLSRRG